MIKQYFQQAWAQLRQQPLISMVNVAGTALSIFLIMLVVMMQQVKVAPFAPESNRDRYLHVRFSTITNKDWGDSSSNGPMSVRTGRELYKSLETPEAVLYTCITVTTPVSLPNQPATAVDVKETDDDFWHVFDFAFIDGKPYDRATFDAGIPVAVITESVARQLFGTTQATGREFLLAHAPYVSTLAESAYAQVWIPFTSTDQVDNTWNNGLMGVMSCTILAKDRADFPAIREECNRRLEAYNQSLAEEGWKFISRNRPYDQEKNALGVAANWEPDVKSARRERWVIFLILLIVPRLRLHAPRAGGADPGREPHRHPAGRSRGAGAQRALCLCGRLGVFRAGVQRNAQPAHCRCLHPAARLHLRVGPAVLLRAQPAQHRHPRLACLAHEHCGGDRREVALMGAAFFRVYLWGELLKPPLAHR